MLDKAKGIQPGSFDPIHHGHTEMIQRNLEKHNLQKLTVWVTYNPMKNWGDFHIQERKGFIEDAIKDLPEDIQQRVTVDFVQGLLVDYCQKCGIKYICKSFRNQKDLEDEEAQAKYNHDINPNIETLLLKADPVSPYSNVSSSGEKVVAGLNANLIYQNTTLRVKQALEVRKNQQYIVWMTGEIGSWKSHTWEEFVKLGAQYNIPVYNIDFDKLGKNILATWPGYQHIRAEIKEAFWDEVMTDNGSIIPHVLAKKVFGKENIDSLNLLNNIMKDSLMVEFREAIKNKKWIIIVNSALLADHSITNMTNNNMVFIQVDKAKQLERILSRENSEERRSTWNPEFTETMAQERIESARSLDKKIAHTIEKQTHNRRGKNIILNNTNPTMAETETAFWETVDAADHDLSLQFRWLCTRLGLLWDTNKLFNDIYFRYLENNLPYHNWNHIKDGIRKINQHRDLFKEPDIVMMAWFFHDIVYNPLAKWWDNELQSAILAKNILSTFWLSPEKLEDIYKLIIATQHTGTGNYSSDEQLMMDIDMSILASDENTYNTYSKCIRVEYSHYPDNLYNPGRAQVLEHFISKPIFYTSTFKWLEKQAQDNIKKEIIALKQAA